MHGLDLSHSVSQHLPTSRETGTMTVPADPNEERARPTWALHTPPLRYDVASLEHWLDLNA